MSAEPAAIVVIAATGMLGTAVSRRLRSKKKKHLAVSRPEVDVTRPLTLEQTLVAGVKTVVNCSAYTDVDGAESNESEAFSVNGEGVAHLARRCAEIGAVLVHYSTDYVFSGAGNHPYPVEHPRHPINAYGRSKVAGEESLAKSDADYLLIRTSWLYAPWSKNFVTTMASLVLAKNQLRVVNDQTGRPTSAEYLADVTMALLDVGARGVYHASDGGQCTWFEFATRIAERINPRCVVEPCASAEFPRPAKRPTYSVLDLSKTEGVIGPSLSWQNNLSGVLSQLVAQGDSDAAC